MKKFFQKLFKRFRKKPKNTKRQTRHRFLAVFVQELPSHTHKDKVYIQVNEGYAWQLAFQCPCGCGTLLHINLLEDMKPYWSYRLENGNLVTLSPSINRTGGCKSHFFLRAGKIQWV